MIGVLISRRELPMDWNIERTLHLVQTFFAPGVALVMLLRARTIGDAMLRLGRTPRAQPTNGNSETSP